jgi:hypothetical protein
MIWVYADYGDLACSDDSGDDGDDDVSKDEVVACKEGETVCVSNGALDLEVDTRREGAVFF